MSSIIFGKDKYYHIWEWNTWCYKRLCCWIWFWYFKTKDIITGSVSLIGAAAGGSLSSALLIGNQTGITL
jgi:hypothetical protein